MDKCTQSVLTLAGVLDSVSSTSIASIPESTSTDCVLKTKSHHMEGEDSFRSEREFLTVLNLLAL